MGVKIDFKRPCLFLEIIGLKVLLAVEISFFSRTSLRDRGFHAAGGKVMPRGS